MKKILSFLLVACFATTLFGQTIVSTTPSNKNVILEEYTGTNCQYCPDGHKIANQIMVNNPGRAWAINIHQGGFSGNDPDYKTEWGNALAQQYNISSYPNATINRGATATTNRSQWPTLSNTILAEPSPVNVAATATINWSTRLLTVYVEVYYTENAANLTNKLNVALLQNNVLGPQVGANLYPAMIRFGNLYQHMHMFRHFLTGQWGVDIPTTSTGTFFSQTFTYTIPDHIRNVPLYLEDLEVLAYVCENQKTILTGCKAELTHENNPTSIGRIEFVENKVVPACDGSNGAICYIRNSNNFAVNSLELTYSIAGGTPDTYLWNKRTIAAQSYDSIHLPTFMLTPNVNQNVVITISKMNGETCNFSFTKTFKKDIVQGEPVMKFVLTTDRYASETRFYIYNPDGTILLQGGPWGDLGSNGTTVREFDFIPIMTGCHKIEVTDSYGDGINSGYGAGNVKILNSAGTQIYFNDGKFGSKLTTMVTVNTVLSTYTITATAGEHGTISPTGGTNYLEGTNAKYTFTPETNYEVEDVLIDGTPMGLPQATEYTFTNLNNNHTIHVKFKKVDGFTITATAGDNGTISPSGETFYPAGATPTYTFTANGEFVVKEVFINDVPMNMEGATEYTFPALDKDYTIHVTFKAIDGIKDINGVVISIAPNPMSDKLFIKGIYDKLEIFSAFGQIITTVHNQPTVDVSNLSQGIYVVKILSNGKTCTFKVVK